MIDPDKSVEGWIPTDDGAFVVNEPQGSPGWYPVNDSPRDKATYDFRVTVPAGKTAVANGELISERTRRGWTTWHWSEDELMSPYLATATNGTFLTEEYEADGVFMYDAVDPNTRVDETDPPNPALAFERLDPQPEIIAFFSDLYGGYPFSAEAASSTGLPTSATRSSPRPAPTTSASPARRPWCTRSPTSGSATRSRSPCGPTSGSTRASRPSRSGSTTSATAGPRRRSRSMSSTRPPRTART